MLGRTLSLRNMASPTYWELTVALVEGLCPKTNSRQQDSSSSVLCPLTLLLSALNTHRVALWSWLHSGYCTEFSTHPCEVYLIFSTLQESTFVQLLIVDLSPRSSPQHWWLQVYTKANSDASGKQIGLIDTAHGSVLLDSFFFGAVVMTKPCSWNFHQTPGDQGSQRASHVVSIPESCCFR